MVKKNHEFCIIHPYTFEVDVREDDCASVPTLNLTCRPASEAPWLLSEALVAITGDRIDCFNCLTFNRYLLYGDHVPGLGISATNKMESRADSDFVFVEPQFSGRIRSFITQIDL